jgi:4-hydroxyphenylpyruvate dioxygenase-like putative hemolysin
VPARTVETDEIKEIVLRDSENAQDFCVVLLTHKDGRKLAHGNTHGALAFYVDDVAQAFDYAIGKGAVPLRAPFQAPGFHVAFVADPEGREIEFLALKK